MEALYELFKLQKLQKKSFLLLIFRGNKQQVVGNKESVECVINFAYVFITFLFFKIYSFLLLTSSFLLAVSVVKIELATNSDKIFSPTSV